MKKPSLKTIDDLMLIGITAINMFLIFKFFSWKLLLVLFLWQWATNISKSRGR